MARGSSTGSSTGPAAAHHATVAHVGSIMNRHLGELSDSMRELLASRIAELSDDPGLIELLGASIEGNVDTILHALQYGIAVERIEPPTAAYEYARRLAQRGVPVNALVRAYRLGQQHLLRAVFDTMRDLDDEERSTAYALVVDMVFDYIDWITQRVVVVYEEEREAWLANVRNEREAAVRRLLAGEDGDLDALERVLGYRLRGRHVAAVAWLDAGTHADQLTRSQRALTVLAQAMGSTRPPLVIGHDQTTTWAWIQAPSGLVSTRPWATWHHDETPAPAIALGSVHAGGDGFRRSHAEALRMQRVALLRNRTERQVVSHDEEAAALAGMLAADVATTRDWVRRVLGGLAERGDSATRHRETLRSFLRHDGSYTATAEAMTMHKNSIRYRIAAAERALGRSITTGRLELEVALTLADLLGDAVLD